MEMDKYYWQWLYIAREGRKWHGMARNGRKDLEVVGSDRNWLIISKNAFFYRKWLEMVMTMIMTIKMMMMMMMKYKKVWPYDSFDCLLYYSYSEHECPSTCQSRPILSTEQMADVTRSCLV